MSESGDITCEHGARLDDACGEYGCFRGAASHDTYVWQEKRRWFWRCLTCGLHPGQTYQRRMDADEAAEDHCLDALTPPPPTEAVVAVRDERGVR